MIARCKTIAAWKHCGRLRSVQSVAPSVVSEDSVEFCVQCYVLSTIEPRKNSML